MAAWLAPVARAADPKSKNAQQKKKSSSELMYDDKAISKQLQWEDKVMGPDDKKAELEKIARANAINKAAAEKAEKEKAERDKQAAREAAQPAPKAKKAEAAIPSLPDEAPSKGRSRESAPRSEPVEAVAATPPPPPAKPADDKFIDKLLKDEGSSRKKSAARPDDKELNDLLAVSKDKPGAHPRGKKADSVDSLLESADKGPAMPAPRSKPVLPEWATKPDVAPSPAPPVAVIRPMPKKNDGVIHVVQGAAAPTAPMTRTAAPPRVVAAAPPPSSRRQAAASRSSGSWNDPFSDAGSKKSAPASRGRDADPFSDEAPAPRRQAAAPAPARQPARSAASSSGWNDPFADSPSSSGSRVTKRPAAPAAAPKARPEPAPRPAAWKDPFGDAGPGPSRTPVAMRERSERPSSTASESNRTASSSSSSSSSSRWGAVIKKRH
jgi:hypothetical protein